MTETVWVSRALGDPTLWRHSFWSEISAWPEEEMIEFWRAYSFALWRPTEKFPKFFRSEQGIIKSLPDFFFAGGVLLVSMRAAEVLNKFDLGMGGLVQAQIMQPDGKTSFSDDFFCLNFGCVKDAFIPELTQGARHVGDLGLDYWQLSSEMKDGQVAVSSDALKGCDLWSNSKVNFSFFVSKYCILL